MKKLVLILSVFFFVNLGFGSIKTNVYVFKSERCPHCQKEKQFLEKIKKNHFNVEIKYFDVFSDEENQKLFKLVVQELKIDSSGLPTTIIGTRYFIGFKDEFTTGREIEKEIENAKKNNSEDIVDKIIKKKRIEPIKKASIQIPEKIIVPLFGEIYLKNLSLPVLTIIFGALDGFNPCAMWALIMLLSFLIVMRNRKKMFLLGTIFIFVSAFVYFLFMVAWLNFFIFFSCIKGIQITIGLIALFGGLYYLKEFFFNKENVCKVSSGRIKNSVYQKMLLLTESKKIYLAIIGIIALAFCVNLIELFCSIGLPVIYTQILSLSSLSTFQHYLYVIFYIFIYMLDDMIVFSIAVLTLHLINQTTKYFRFSHLIGGIVLLVIGFLLIFKPQYLTF